MTVGYKNREGANGDLPPLPKIIIVNKLMKDISGLSIGDKIMEEYLEETIIIRKLK